MRTRTRCSRLAALLLIGLSGAAGQAHAQTPAPTPDPPLSAQRVQGIQPGAEAAVVLDRTAPNRAGLTRLAKACRTSTFTDPVVKSFRSVCRNEAAGLIAERRVTTCKTPDRCRARLDRYTSTLTAQITASRKLNTVLTTAVPDPDCRRALRIPQSTLSVVVRLQSSSRAMQQALKDGSPKRFAAALRRFYGVDRAALLNHQGRLDAFRASCV